jgi:hypothetical protein
MDWQPIQMWMRPLVSFRLRRPQTDRDLTVALATPDGDEVINCAVRGAVDDLNLATDAVPSEHPAGP